MILTESVEYRGKQLRVNELRPSSTKQVDVMCPSCGRTRTVEYRRVVANGHYMCQKCALKEKRRKKLKLGSRYSRLTVISHSSRAGYSICKCECGNQAEVANWSLEHGKTRSCGCLQKEKAAASARKLVRTGENHHNWKGGVSSEYERTRATRQFKDFLKTVRDRDNYQCRKCGISKNGMHAHHIKPIRFYPELICDPDNAVLLCPKCHRRFHKIYGRNATERNLNEFLSLKQERKHAKGGI